MLAKRVEAEDRRKYAGYRTPPELMPEATRLHYLDTPRVLIRLTPDERILTWSNAKLGIE